MTTDWQNVFLTEHKIGNDYLANVRQVLPWLEQTVNHAQGTPLCIAINGAQGSGKSTLSAYLVAHLQASGLNAACVSLDDFYLSQQQRLALASETHPLFKTRGVPGTHDIEHAIELVKAFKAKKTITLPKFSKALDEPLPKQQWQTLTKPLDVLIFEGWCVGVPAQPDDALHTAINTFEQTQDPDAIFRRAVNQHLYAEYQTLWALFDTLIYLNPQSFKRVFAWRLEQEQKLIAKTGKGMTEQQVNAFIQFFERLTVWGIESMPKRCDLHVRLNEKREFEV